MNPRYFKIGGMAAVVQSDTVDLTGYNDGVYVEAAGDVAIEFTDGTSHTFTLEAKDTIACSISKILSTGTTIADANIFTFKLDL